MHKSSSEKRDVFLVTILMYAYRSPSNGGGVIARQER